jgi:hypothetical protein
MLKNNKKCFKTELIYIISYWFDLDQSFVDNPNSKNKQIKIMQSAFFVVNVSHSRSQISEDW